MKNINKKRRIASALAILSTVSTMAMPISTLAANADEVIEEVPAIVQEATVAEDEDCGIESIDSVEETTEEKAEETTEEKAEAKEEKVETAAEKKQKIKNYFKEEFKDFDSNAYAGKLDYTHEAALGMQRSGKNLIITKSKHVDNSQNRTHFAIVDRDTAIYPGALVRADEDLAKGEPRIIDLDRGEWTIRLTEGPAALGSHRDRVVSDVTSARNMKSMIEDYCLSDKEAAPAHYECNIEKIYSDEQLKAKAHLEQNVYGKLEASLDSGIGTTKQAVLIDYTQVYYKISADMPKKENLFADDVNLKDIQEEINKDNPAAIVSSVDYGRRIVACIETNDNTFDLEAAVNASGFKDAIKGTASLNMNNKLSNCQVHYYVYGGESKKSGGIMTGLAAEALPTIVKTIADGTSYERNIALPIAYTTNFIHDNKPAKVNFKEDYYVNVAETHTPTAINISSGNMYAGFFGGWFGDFGNVESHSVKLTGKRIEALDENGDYVYSPEETIYERVFRGENISEKGFEAIPSDYDLSTVRVYFDYTGNKRTGFRDSENGIKLTDIVGNPTDIKKVDIDIKSVASNSTFKYIVFGNVKVTDESGKTHEKRIWDDHTFGLRYANRFYQSSYDD